MRRMLAPVIKISTGDEGDHRDYDGRRHLPHLVPGAKGGTLVPVRPGQSIDPAATRRRILRTAERVFYRRGITTVGVSDIAEAAGASKASIYRNFGSKEGLIEATLSYRSERVHRWLAEDTAHLAVGAERVLGVFDLLLAWYHEDDFRGCAMVSAAAEDRVGDTPATRLAREHLNTYRRFLTACLTDAGAQDAQTLARRLLILIEGATVISAIDHEPAAGEDARALAAELLHAAVNNSSRGLDTTDIHRAAAGQHATAGRPPG